MTKRRAKWGNGHYYRNSKGVYCVRIYSGELDEQGRRVRKVINTGERTLTAARRKGREALVDRDRLLGDDPTPPVRRTTTADLTYDAAIEHLDQRNRTRGKSTRLRTTHLKKKFAGWRWSTITREEVEQLVDEMRADGLAWSTIKNTIATRLGRI